MKQWNKLGANECDAQPTLNVCKTFTCVLDLVAIILYYCCPSKEIEFWQIIAVSRVFTNNRYTQTDSSYYCDRPQANWYTGI